ncbi:UNVERIFIED_CONTAM: hypothetical protein Sradi_3185600 [Sesamum radiatum]|uniref:Reverse transcriptase domain-containing protein n=1 Tax=Sesamum radiatum TaxID=300843 RepID=A0AAW2RFJ4_SESRA
MSPFLFVLVMEVLQLKLQQFIEQDGGFSYHWKCEGIGLFQLCFADDLLLFCKADIPSVTVFKRGLEEFAKMSGLRANPQKSQMILFRSAFGMKELLLNILGFPEGHLPLRYLGLPLLSSRLTISDRQPLLIKIDSRIKGWEGIQLSFAGRLQLIKSVLLALNIYWAMAFILPKGVIKEVEKRLRGFLWKGHSNEGYPKVAWNLVCRPIEEGGQGIRDLHALNRALMSRHLWNVIIGSSTSIWVTWIVIIDFETSLYGWLILGPLISRFPWGSSILQLSETSKLSSVIIEGNGIGHLLQLWSAMRSFKTYLTHVVCIYSRQCLYGLKRAVRFYWRNHSWVSDVIWAARKWRGKHYVNATFRALPASILYHIWQERNRRVFQGIERPSSSVVHAAVDEIRQRIVTVDLPNSVSKRGLYRLWRIPWSDEGTA